MKRHLAFVWLAWGLALMLIPFGFVLKSRVSASNLKTKTRAHELARLAAAATVHAAGRGAPWMNLTDGRDLLTSYAEVSKDEQVPRQDTFKPVAMASGDYDEDGIPDLISGYGVSSDGVITLHRGNVDAIYPNSPEAKQRKSQGAFTDSPFLSPASLFEIASEPDFVAAGDFDADSHWDVVAATRGGNSLYLLPGDGRGGFGAATRIGLPGSVTALVAGEINRRDGLVDLVVGIVGDDGPKAMVFEGPRGALKTEPEVFALPSAATAFALGHLDHDRWPDLAIAAGSELVIVHGRDRKLSLDEGKQAEVDRATVSHRSLPFIIKAIAAGDFTGSKRTELALLADDGTINLLSEAKGKINKSNEGIQNWRRKALSQGAWPRAAQLVRTRMSSLPADSLVVVDSASHQLHVVVDDTATREIRSAVNVSASLDVEGEPVAVLPMRLNADALDDLIILRSGNGAPSVVITAPAMSFPVTNTLDGANPGPAGSLRRAINDANANAGADTISFSIGSGQQTINLTSPLPTIAEAVTIDGTTQPGFSGQPLIELNFNGAGATPAGLMVSGGGSVVRGLVINNVHDSAPVLGDGIQLNTAGNNFIEGNFLGTDPAGTAARANDAYGVHIMNAGGNIVGGTVAAARNLLSGNVSNGVDIAGAASTGNQVQGNFIGTNAAGTAAVPNVNTAVVVFLDASNNTIGGTTAGARNVISGNIGHGVQVSGPVSTGNLVQGNFIGTNPAGTVAIPNANAGVALFPSTSNTVGGTAPGARNLISGNMAGVAIEMGGGNNTVQGNLIGTDATGTAALANAMYGVRLMQTTNNLIGGTTAGARNIISGNTQSGVLILNAGTTGNVIIGNFIGTDISSGLALGNGGNGVLVQSSASNNSIGGTIAGFGNTIAFNNINGIAISGGTGNAVLGNSIFANANLGIDLNDDGGVTANDLCDVDGGSNNSQNFPDLTTAQTTGSNIGITGNLNSTQNTTYRIEFFSNNLCDGSSNGEGEMFIGSTNVTTPGAGCDAPISVNLPATVAAGTFVTATATDPLNNTSEFSHCVMVTAAACTMTCPANFSRSNDPNQCGAVIAYPPPTTSGSCGSVSCSPASGSFFPVGSTLVTCTSAAGPTCNFTVTVNDTQPPTITCPANISQPAPVGSCSAVVNYPDAPANDNCPGLGAPMCTPPSGSTFQGGVTMVTCTVADATGNTANCTFTITITDTQPPTITCPANITQGTASNQCGATVAYAAPTVSDNCPGVGTPSCNPPSGSTFPKGVTPVNCSVSDASSNTANCGFTVTINDTTPPTITCPANQSVVSGVATVVNYPPPTAADNCSGVNSSCAPPSGSVFAPGMTTVTCTATDTSANNAMCAFTVTVAPCTIKCPNDVIAHIGSNATTCGGNVSYPPPDVAGGCGPATCNPASGSFFSVGTTVVSCSIGGGVNCSFTVIVLDDAAPRITCPNSIVTAPSPGQSSAVVNYPAAVVTDNCPGATAQCSPPTGSRFPLGTTFVTCTAIDASSNSAACVFSIIVVDSERPVITCPANVAVGTLSGQTSAVVNYPPPNVNDNSAGVTSGCLPASGSSFPLGVTTVTCTATDAAGNKSSCSFTVSVGGAVAKVVIPANKAVVEFGSPSPVAPARKPPKAKKNPCGLFSIQNIGFAPLVLTLDSITRTGSDVDSKKISDANDTKYFSLSTTDLVGTIDIGGVVTIQPGASQSFCLRFIALIPALAGKASGVAAADALPDTVTSVVTFRQNTGAQVSVPVLSHLATAVIFINPANPRQAPSIGFIRSGNDITVSYALYDPNLDVSRAKYEFLNSSGQVVGSAFEIDLAEQLRALGLVRGQSFSVEQRFTGASDHPEIVGVRVTVFDGETSVTASATAASVASASEQLLSRTGGDRFYLPVVQLIAPLP